MLYVNKVVKKGNEPAKKNAEKAEAKKESKKK